ncbi:MAG: bifunctional folylpolyglutamate synthase/dihydrofolate synthase, partial [Lachnospiraceae bacterium]|nr:bifunctional folylpolyglutamate synthase/dihydrofolate synthase [Lachnospiraceae bacterium]
MNYKDSIDYIDKLYIGKSKEPTLDRIKKALEALSFDDDLKAVHIAGTNGKGSTCSMIANILKKSGYKVGLYTSPHLVKINERIKINDVDISDDDFAKYVTRVVDAIEKNNIELLFFEVLTVVAFLYFQDEKCDIVVLETGMGGEYDATNVIKNPLCTVITNIGLDHEDILGVGIDNIAKAKAGIMKENVDCVVYDIKDGRKVFEDVALKKHAKIHFANFNNIIYHD